MYKLLMIIIIIIINSNKIKDSRFTLQFQMYIQCSSSRSEYCIYAEHYNRPSNVVHIGVNYHYSFKRDLRFESAVIAERSDFESISKQYIVTGLDFTYCTFCFLTF